MSDAEISYFSVMLKTIRDEVRIIIEAVGDMQKNVAYIPPLRDAIYELQQDMRTSRAAILDVSRQVYDHEVRITKLEAA
jgi:hypothetical protein